MLARAGFRVSIWRTGTSGWVVLPHLLLLCGATTVSLLPAIAATEKSPPESLRLLKVCDQAGHSIPCSSATAFGFFVFAKDAQTQLAVMPSCGEFVQAYYGNNSFNPVGIWEARPIPGTNAIIATTATHHATTAGSIIRVDITHGQDGPQAITRLTPDALFPESEVPGSRPFSYPLLVQPVLDRHCVACHNSTKAEGGIVLTGQPAGRYSVSYNTLAKYVPYSDWAGKPGDFRVVNCEPTTKPDFFGARASRLTQLLLQDHHGVKLSQEDWERLYTWMDCNVLFYGTFNLADQQRQQRGEVITGPDLE